MYRMFDCLSDLHIYFEPRTFEHRLWLAVAGDMCLSIDRVLYTVLTCCMCVCGVLVLDEYSSRA